MGRATRTATALWLALGLAHAVSISPDLLNDAQQHHCGGHCGNRGASATLHVSLHGLGAHRHLMYRLAVRCPQLDDRSGEGDQAATATSPPPPPPPCCTEAALLQPLPPAVFADVYQLENAAAVGQGPAVKLFGPVDVESIERHSPPTLLAVYSRCNQSAGMDAKVVAGSCSEVVVEVPLHARYPHPQDPRQQLRQQSGGNSGWAAAALSAAATAELPPPRVLVRCPGDEQGDGGWQAADIDGTGRGAAAGVWWDMPAGNVRHGPLVAAGTTAAMACGATAVLLVLCRSQTAVWRKQQ